MINMSKAW